MKQHIITICQTAYNELKRVSSIRRYLTEDGTKQLVNFLCFVQIILAILSSWALSALLFNPCRKSIMMLHALFSEHHAIKTARVSYINSSSLSFWRNQIYFWTTTPLLSFPLAPFFIRHTRVQTRTLQPQNPWLSHFLTLRSSHLEQSPPRSALCSLES